MRFPEWFRELNALLYEQDEQQLTESEATTLYESGGFKHYKPALAADHIVEERLADAQAHEPEDYWA